MENEDLLPENVIEFRPDQTERPIALKPKQNMFEKCNHRAFVLDEEKRTVECGKCGEILDPWFVLTIFASTTRMKDYRLDEFKKYQEHQAAEKEKRRLKWERRNEKNPPNPNCIIHHA